MRDLYVGRYAACFHSIRYRHKATVANSGFINFQKGVQMNHNFHLHTLYPNDTLLIGLLLLEQCLEAQQTFIPFRTNSLDPLIELFERFRR
jgi:hypothetical protein